MVLYYTYTETLGAIMLENKQLTAQELQAMIEQLDTIADRLFLAGRNTAGNAAQEVAYLLHAQLADIEEEQQG
jgi:hypothetical protein